VCGALLVAACGGSSNSSTHVTATSSASSTWAAQTQALCRQKRAAIAQLGYVNITYAGIARVGLPAVKRSLDAYLGRLLTVLRSFSARQRAVSTPPAFVSTMATASAIDAESQAATAKLRAEIAGVANARQLSAAFNSWLATLKHLSAQGDAVARQLNLPACRSGSAGAG
jgi:hypothetical protein